MNRIFVKKFWPEENTTFFLHFEDGEAVRQLEISENGVIRLSKEEPQKGDSMLYDQALEDLDLLDSDFISEDEFDEAWNNSI